MGESGGRRRITGEPAAAVAAGIKQTFSTYAQALWKQAFTRGSEAVRDDEQLHYLLVALTVRPRAPSVCSIGTVDPTGAAGLAADLRVFALSGVIGQVAVAGVSAQNAARVRRVIALPPEMIRAQLESVWEEARPQAICIGLLPGPAAIKCVRKFLEAQARLPAVVVDPVISSSSGHAFLRRDGVANLKALLRLATIVTPNVEELSRLSALPVHDVASVEAAARALAALGCAVLATGGHLTGRDCVDVLVRDSRASRYRSTRLPGSMRGMGGILAAALAAHLARGESLERAVAKARAFVRAGLALKLRSMGRMTDRRAAWRSHPPRP